MREAGKEEVRQTQERGHREYLGDKSMDQVGGPGGERTYEMEAGKEEVRQTQERGHREYLGDKSMDKWEGQSQRKGNLRDGGREGRGDADPGSGWENEGDEIQ